MKKTVFFGFFAVLLAFTVALSASALTISIKPTDRFFVNDFANVITTTDEQAIYTAGVQLQEKTGAQVVAVTVDTIEGADINEYATQLGRAWGVGDAEKDTGIVLLLAIQEREIGIAVGYGLEGAVTDVQSGVILDTYALPYFQENDFSSGMSAAYDALVNEVYLEFGMEADPDYVPVDELEQKSTVSTIGFLLALCILSFLLSRNRARHGGILFLPIGPFGGGGFGHFRGGGGGGFRGGGGSFGGGGASRGF